MAHFAEVNENNVVIRVLVINNEVLQDENGIEIEQKGIDFCRETYGGNNKWIQTSYNNNFRKWYASAGFIYDEELDAFYVPQPFPSWVLDEEQCVWNAPIPKPDEENIYLWNEETLSWDAISNGA